MLTFIHSIFPVIVASWDAGYYGNLGVFMLNDFMIKMLEPVAAKGK